METLNMLCGNRNNLYFSCANPWGFDHFLYVSASQHFLSQHTLGRQYPPENWVPIACNRVQRKKLYFHSF